MASSDGASRPSSRLKAVGMELPEPHEPLAQFVNYRQIGNLLFISGQGPRKADGTFHTGKVGAGVSLSEARVHARITGMNVLAVAQAALGSLDRVEAVVKLFGMVNATPEFGDHPKVIDGCSELFVEILGEAGRHARSAIGVGSLPNNITVEIEAILAIRP